MGIHPGRVEVTAVEIDPTLIPALQRTAELCRRCGDAEISINVIQGDIINLSPKLNSIFDLIIINPPYKKLGALSPVRHTLVSLIWDAPNIYAAFISIGADALIPGGQLVAITPRSFANGPYFGSFRKAFLRQMAIDRLHIFESRSSVFADTGVLQENIVFSCTKNGVRGPVTIISSRDTEGVANEKVVPYSQVVEPTDPAQYIRVAIDGGAGGGECANDISG